MALGYGRKYGRVLMRRKMSASNARAMRQGAAPRAGWADQRVEDIQAGLPPGIARVLRWRSFRATAEEVRKGLAG